MLVSVQSLIILLFGELSNKLRIHLDQKNEQPLSWDIVQSLIVIR